MDSIAKSVRIMEKGKYRSGRKGPQRSQATCMIENCQLCAWPLEYEMRKSAQEAIGWKGSHWPEGIRDVGAFF